MSLVFADTVGIVARWNESDQWYESAVRAYAGLPETDVLVTTPFVLLECGNACARTIFRPQVDQLRHQHELDGTLIWPTDDEWRRAWAAYRRGEAGEASIVDHISFVVMRRLGITHAFTNDRHFTTAGFEILMK